MIRGSTSNKMVNNKHSNSHLDIYKIGDEVSIPDGAYIGNEGVVVISGHILVVVVKHIFNKIGSELIKHNFINDIMIDYPTGYVDITLPSYKKKNNRIKHISPNSIEAEKSIGGSLI